MRLIRYWREKGFRRFFQVLWQYKLHTFLCRLLLPLLGRLPLLDAIVLESHNDFDSNGGAFYRYLLENGYNRRYTIIWLVKNKKPKDLPSGVRCYRLHSPSFGKAYWLCRAKYLCYDNEISHKLRKDQTLVFCDHGAVALKSIQGVYTVPKDVDVVLAPSDAFAPTLAREYELTDLTKFHPIGYPYHDVFYRETPNELEKITKRQYRKVFLWMPTFRKGGGYHRSDTTAQQPFGVPLLETDGDYQALQDFLQQHDCLLILKIHPMQDKSTLSRLRETDNIRILTGDTVKALGIDNYRLVKAADALISDYSSIAFSYLLLDRPMAFVLSDLQDYRRGFSMDNPEDFLVGQQIMHFTDFYAFLQSVLEGRDPWQEKRQALARWLYTYHDGNACQRLAELLGLEK